MNMRPSAKGKLASSLTMKIFAVCFGATHIPLLALVIYMALQHDTLLSPIVGIVLLATLAGTVFCLASVWMMIRPLHHVAGIIDLYRSTGTVRAVHSSRSDEIGMVATGVSTLISELDASLSQLRRQATTDVLTGLGNRRWLKEIGSMELARAVRERTPVCLIVFDLDHFKSINDTHGHDVGDQVLMLAGATIQHNLRPYDIAARIGGEEFCVILPRTNTAAAISIADRLRRELESKAVGPLAAGAVTASVGVYRGDPGNETLKTMMMAADRKLYDAKSAGRNTIQWDVARGLASTPGDFEQ